MGIDTDVLLRVRDRGALRDALESHAEKVRKEWADQGREAAYDELVAGGYDPKPLLRPLEDGSVSIFTGLRFHDRDMEYAIRCWLDAHFGDALSRIHDDPRGVFVTPDVCEPRAKTYDGIVAELKDAGRFIDPSPPTKEEHDARMKSMEASLAAMDACQKARAAGDEHAFQRALAAAPEDVRAAWGAQDEVAQHVAAFASGPKTFEITDLSAFGGAATAMQAEMLGLDRVAMLAPAAVASALAANPLPQLDVQERTELADGSAILVTSHGGDTDFVASFAGEGLAATGLDLATLTTIPFFRETLVKEIASEQTFADAKRALGDRFVAIDLRSPQERMQDERKAVATWLEKKDES